MTSRTAPSACSCPEGRGNATEAPRGHAVSQRYLLGSAGTMSPPRSHGAAWERATSAPGGHLPTGRHGIREAISAAASFVADIFADNIFGFPSSVQVHDGADRHPGLG
ncbi:MAG: hypothetical protein EBE86_019380 [Hormoscilla sp. GUM202]|nr:hypothetical protein [Hormoscilla sp. GUM202]